MAKINLNQLDLFLWEPVAAATLSAVRGVSPLAQAYDAVDNILADRKNDRHKKLVKMGYTRDQIKVMDEGFFLIKYIREEKKILCTGMDPLNGWYLHGIYETYAKAERILKDLYAGPMNVRIGEGNEIIMTGWNQPGGLLKAGFEFYRVYGLRDYDAGFCIKQGSKNWSNWKKFSNREELQTAWDNLMNNDLKALEG